MITIPLFIIFCLVLCECGTASVLPRKWDGHWTLETGKSQSPLRLRPIGIAPIRDSFRWNSNDISPRINNNEVFQMTQKNKGKCGYESCNLGKPGVLNVHMVPHTHDDVGWLKTVDQYYYGARSEIRHAGVQYILDTVIDQLQKDPQKRFIYVEIAFFYRWWQEQHDSSRHIIKGLVNQGRLEFILGGWCMNDEASTHYNAIIDQHTVGFRFIQRNFGDCGRPKIGWQIDPFGHSREQASLFAQFGFDGLFFGRLDYQDKDKRLNNRTMEHMWLGSQSLGDASALFTGVNYNGYGPPPGFCYDIGCSDQPIMDNPDLEDYNVDKKVQQFLTAARDQAKHYTTNHIMMTMGSDFQFENAHENFKNIDKLMKYVNQQQSHGSGVNVLYSTPSCYLYALNQANQTYTTKSDDFFPYASRPHTFWTGYFTSRPALKGYVRTTNNFLQICKQLDVLANLGPEYGSAIKLDVLRKAMGVAQHHDAVSGTEQQHVADDYAKRLSRGVAACQEVVNYAYGKLLPVSSSQISTDHTFCPLLNASYCHITESTDKFTVLVYNPIGRQLSFWVQIPVNGAVYTVLDSDLKPIQSQLMPLSAATTNLPDHNGSHANATLVFQTTLPPVGFSTYFITKTSVHHSDLPVHVVGHTSMTLGLSRTLRIKCDIPSTPLHWYKDGIELHDNQLTTVNGTWLRRILMSDPEDSGSYHCEAVVGNERWVQYWNIHISSSVSGRRPRAPHDLLATPISNTSLRLSWKQHYSRRNMIVAYSVHYTSQDGVVLQKVTKASDIILDQLTPGSDYIIFVIAYSASVASRQSASLEIRMPGPYENMRRRNSPIQQNEDMVIENEHLRLSFRKSTGMLSSMTPIGSSNPLPIRQSLLYYQAYKGNNSKPVFQSSGAYIFRPNSSHPIPVADNQVKIKIVKGELVQEVHQVFSDWATQTIRLYKGAQYAEFEWTVGPIPIKDGIGKEVISEFTTDLNTKGMFYTDSNGREILKRVRDYRPTWKLNQTERVAGNYYPVNSRIYIRDEQKDIQLTILTDRSQGGASIHDGQVELMVHRRMLVDDLYGVGEPLNETGITGKGLVVRGKHYVMLSSVSQAAALHRDLAERLYMAPSISFQSLNITPQKYKTMYRTKWTALSSALPPNVHLLTLEEWEANSFLLRLEHFYEKNEDPVLSQSATIHLKALFVPFHISSVEELTLGANQKLSDAQRLRWNIQGQGRTNGNMSSFVKPVDPATLTVTLNPMQIRTFQVFFD